MINLELKYIKNLCTNLLISDKEFDEKFEAYANNYSADNNLDFNYNNEQFNKFIEDRVDYFNNRKLHKDKYIPEIDDRQLSFLFQYIINILHLSEKQDNLRKEIYCNLPALSGYQFSDSRLASLELNNKEHTGKFIFKNVLCYDEKRNNKNESVDVADVEVQFMNVTEVKIKGTIRSDDLDYNAIHDDVVYQTSDASYCFSLFCLVGHEKCKIDITFSDVISKNIQL